MIKTLKWIYNLGYDKGFDDGKELARREHAELKRKSSFNKMLDDMMTPKVIKSKRSEL